MKWHIGHIGEETHRREVIFDANYGQVAEIITPGAIAEARLMAASPVMLEALRAVAALADGQGRANLVEVAAMARNAINIATGE